VLLSVLCLGHIHDQGHVRGHTVGVATGLAVGVAAGHGGDIEVAVIAVAVIVTIEVVATHDVVVAVEVSHRDAVGVTPSTTTAMNKQTNGREVAANQQMTRMTVQLEMTNHHREKSMRVLPMGIRLPMNSREMVTMTM